ncbi:MAG: RNA polymerase sigma factor [Actinomycetota bacterium]
MRPDRAGTTDEDLLALFLEHDDEAFAELMARHEDRIFAVTLRITGNRADALDATQDAFIAAYRRAGSFRGDASFGTWLYRIAINSSKDLLRKKARAPVPEGDPSAFDRPASARRVEDDVGLRVDVSRALAMLQDEYRESVVLHDLGGVPYDEIARITGVSIGTVKSRISRGRRKLADLMEQPRRSGASKETT